jgi:xylan 1,4-beta-xylosidase
MMGMLGVSKPGGKWLLVSSDGAQMLDSIIANGVTGAPDVNAVATRNGDEVDVLLWNYHDADVTASPSEVTLQVDGLKARVSYSEFLMDGTHSNSYNAWQAMGSPDHPDAQQIDALQKAGQLDQITKAQPLQVQHGTATLKLALPRQAVALICLRPGKSKN